MKLSELIHHTAETMDLSASIVNTVARVLTPAGLITSAGRNPQGAVMSPRDCATLLVAVCATSAANKAAIEFSEWIRHVPELIQYIERRVETRSSDNVTLEFDIGAFCARKITASRVQTFGARPESASFLTRTVTSKAFTNWVEGLQ